MVPVGSFPDAGSSPLTRGARICPGTLLGMAGLIPAHAGSTRVGNRCISSRRAHPRSRGEHHITKAQLEDLIGSSPLTRGAPSPPLGSGPAGGSSPLTRGAQQQKCLNSGFGGLIPAHAGSTVTLSSPSSAMRAHPRSRGEHGTLNIADQESRGSSPLTRGARFQLGACAPVGGLIPAHAGSTRRIRPALVLSPAHPRSRGEHLDRTLAYHAHTGSSPLTRGARVRVPALGAPPRLIPAHAGSTRARRVVHCLDGAHPRSRGEHSAFHLPTPGLFGSSPLTRGAQHGS